MALGKQRGRKPNKKTVKARSELQKKQHWLDCKECEIYGSWVDGDVTDFLCAWCVQKAIPGPALPKPRKSLEEREEAKVGREERKKERLAKKGERKALGLGRGWHLKVAFTAELDGKPVYFSKGKKITKAAYTKLVKVQQKAAKAKIKPTAGFGRGWHFMDVFYAPNGDRYEKGKLAKKATKEPTEQELDSLMEQNV